MTLQAAIGPDVDDAGVKLTTFAKATALEEAFDSQIVKKDNYKKIALERSTVEAIVQRIADIDKQITEQLNEVLHDDDFQALEATWRGLQYLVMKTETSTRLKLRVVHATQKELQDDLDKAVDHDQSALFKKVYEDEYGTYGGKPYGLLVGDYYFGRSALDIRLLQKLSNVAAAAHAPFIAAAAPEMFNLEEDYVDLPKPRDLSKIFEIQDSKWIRWNAFRAETEDSRYVSLTLPRILMRSPYGPAEKGFDPVEGYDFTEEVLEFKDPAQAAEDGDTKPVQGIHGNYLWGNPAWAFGERITKAFALYGWYGAIRGVEGGGLVRGLPIHTFQIDTDEYVMKGPTEVMLTDRRERELDQLGFIGLIHEKGSGNATFFGGATAQKPTEYDLAAATANAKLSAVLPYVLAASRFAHYLKVICRDKIGSFLSAENMQAFLNRWIQMYILGKDDASQEAKASYPLREARVDVTEIPGRPGSYNATVFLRPHFQLEELTTSIRLVAELPPPAA